MFWIFYWLLLMAVKKIFLKNFASQKSQVGVDEALLMIDLSHSSVLLSKGWQSSPQKGRIDLGRNPKAAKEKKACYTDSLMLKIMLFLCLTHLHVSQIIKCVGHENTPLIKILFHQISPIFVSNTNTFKDFILKTAKSLNVFGTKIVDNWWGRNLQVCIRGIRFWSSMFILSNTFTDQQYHQLSKTRCAKI